ncbi:MAG TPA: MFS transporter [Ktedonobacterales bacterium]|nr:MFS transporter [Ktedonobacterales bacterium]
MNAIHTGTGSLVEERPVGEEQKKNKAFGPPKVRNFQLLFGGQTISVLGDALYVVALPWLILTTGGSTEELGLVLAAYGIPRALSMLLGGWLSDRLRPRRVMLIADVARLLLVGLLAMLALGGHPPLWQLCALAVPLGAFGGAFLPASQAIVPEMLSPDDLQAGNGLMQASRQGANLIGAAGAGVVVAAVSAGVALAIDAFTFLLSAFSLALMRPTSRATPGMGKQTVRQEQEAASMQEPAEQISLWRYLRTSRLFQVTLLMFSMIGLVSGGLIEVALPALVRGPLHGNASAFGLILAAWGAGALIGALVAGALGKRPHKGLIMLLAGLLMGALIALLPIWDIAFAVVCMLLAGIAGGIVNVVLFTAIQRAIPSHLMGRVMGLLLFGSFGVYPFSVALAGVLSDHLGPASFFPVSGLLLVLAMLCGLMQRVLRAI